MEALAARASRWLGKTIGGKYELREVLGIGGMATVYGAVHRNGLPVAIKILHDALASDPGTRRWFLREAYLANRVSHRGAVRVLDDDATEDGVVYLVIERLHGETLRAIWERSARKMAPRDVAVLLYDVLDVLAAAHARGIVHRDVKPENLFVTDEGDVKVLDFGIAHPLPVVGEAAAASTFRLAGTPAYMAPEQARGQGVRPETDVWGAGATAFTLLVGEYVHANAPPPDLLVWAANRSARELASVAADVPASLAAVIDRALTFEPEQRYASAAAMRTALGEAFQAAFHESITDARAAVVAALRGRNAPAVQHLAPNVHSIATQAPVSTPSGSSDLRAAVINARGPALDVAPPSRARRTRWLAAIAGVAVAAAGVVGVGVRATSRSIAPAVAPEVTTPGLTRYRAGLDAWHDQRRSDVDLRAALEIDPSLAAAHLALAVVPRFPTPDAYSHFAAALARRATLSDRDRALLDAFEPAMRVPDDLEESRRRLEPLVDRFSEDFRFAHALGSVLMRLNDGAALLRVGQAAVRADPTAGTSWSLEALGYDLLGDAAKARESFERCISNARLATNCVAMLTTLEENEGRCERVEQLAQNLLVSGDKSPETFAYLADGVFGRTRDPAMLQTVLERAWRGATPPISTSMRTEQTIAQAVLAGDFDRALAVARDFEGLVASSESVSARLPAVGYTIDLAQELGRPVEAADRAKRFAAEIPALDSNPLVDYSIAFDEELAQAGVISEGEFALRRDAWVKRQAPRFAHRYGGFAFVWTYAYALPAHTHAAAVDALAHMHEYLPITDPLNRPASRDEAIGRVYLLAGQPAEAAPYLEKAARSCTAVLRPFESVRAALELGMARAALGANDEACATLAQVTRAWGRDPRSVTARKALRLSSELHCTKERTTHE